MSQGNPNPNISTSGSSKVMPIFTGDYGACDEGSFFVTTLAATASTAVACTTQALADTNPELGIYNGQATGGYNCYLRYIKRLITVVGGSNTTVRYSSLVDNLTVKLTTTGTALSTPANTNTSSSTTSLVTGYGGVNVAAAQTSNGRRVGAGTVYGAVETVFSETIFDFGPPVYGKNFNGAAALGARTVPHPPVILAPGYWFTLGTWGVSKAAAADTLEWEIGFVMRPAGQ